jgi:hypothetical protein
MAWFSKKRDDVAVVEQVAPKKITTGPRLAVLTPDIAGISTFKLSLQDDATDAEQLVSGLRADVRRGTHAFWAMHDQPAVDESMHVEALVLIRAKPDSDLVYVVSFLDLESALSFTRFELRRGLYIGNVMIYWAAFTQIREELEGVTILPNVAPPSIDKYLGPDPRLAPPLPTPQASVSIAEPVITEPEPAPESIAESEARLAVERYIEQNPDVAAPLAAPEPIAEEPGVIEDSVAVIEPPVIESLPIFDDEPVTEEAAVADALVLQHPPVAEPIVEIVPEPIAEVAAEPVAEVAPPASDLVFNRRKAPFTPKRKWSAREERARAAAEQQPEVVAETHPEVTFETPEVLAEMPEVLAQEPVLLEEPVLLAEEPAIITHEPITSVAEAFQPQAGLAPQVIADEALALEAQESAALQIIADRISTYAGDEEAESEAAIEIEARSPAIDPANGLPQAEKYNEFDIALEVERLLKNRKWESREGPFRGFKSPPGRF